jgi:hypothetical protein
VSINNQSQKEGTVSKKGFVAAIGLGSGLMFFLDPDRGKRRRAMVRDRAAHLARQTSRYADKTMRDVANRTHGLAVEAQSLLRHEPIPDEILEARIQTRIGRLVSRPHHVQVIVSSGRVTLEGTVLPNEMVRLVAGIATMRGVVGVTNHLHPFGVESHGPTPAGEALSNGFSIPETWPPATRFAAGVAGGMAAAAGLWMGGNRGVIAAMLTMSGTSLLARSVSNQRLTRLAGLTAPAKLDS